MIIIRTEMPELTTPPETLIDEFARACTGAGIAPTPQRRLIYRVLAESHDHPDAEAVYQRVRAHLPRVSLATVYRNLRRFSDAGIIEEVATGGASVRYDANRHRHHHLVCNRCGRVSDFYSDRIDALRGDGDVARAAAGFDVEELKVSVYGVCSGCKQASQPTK